jgi:hypothetical protein
LRLQTETTNEKMATGVQCAGAGSRTGTGTGTVSTKNENISKLSLNRASDGNDGQSLGIEELPG